MQQPPQHPGAWPNAAAAGGDPRAPPPTSPPTLVRVHCQAAGCGTMLLVNVPRGHAEPGDTITVVCGGCERVLSATLPTTADAGAGAGAGAAAAAPAAAAAMPFDGASLQAFRQHFNAPAAGLSLLQPPPPPQQQQQQQQQQHTMERAVTSGAAAARPIHAPVVSNTVTTAGPSTLALPRHAPAPPPQDA
jgi:hypothetical protein